MGSLERYCAELDAARLKALCKNRDEAVAQVAAEVQRLADRTRRKVKTTTGAPSQSYSYTINCSPSVSPAPKKGITPGARDAELNRIRDRFERERQLTILAARVMSQWQD
jgi:hypothetical protein